ncbi:M24 family metallopeptidase [Saccharopolyspora sp. 6M]|uniref:M24 family metallopeptidase n=1 Tax=Saccharopolyspora sp. 6M TaxID=2877237 RepID=UPI001CD3E17F|nr:M24 family metallopeptidase [Saccharopolyspora sp. 6M]MCA1228845.1 M24 family metallopeptidase [Saccharopolyspora sp. 6M]
MVETAAPTIDSDLTQVERAAAAAELAAVGYTAVTDHLHVGQDVREIAANVDRSTRRAGGLLGWFPELAPGTAGCDLVTIHGHDPATARLTASEPVRYALHPLLDGVRGYAAATAVLSEPGAELRAAGEKCSAATKALLGALQPGALLRDAYRAFDDAARDRHAGCGIVALGEPTAVTLPRDDARVAEPGTVVGIRTRVGAIEFAETVLMTAAGAEPLAKTPLRLVELY